MAGTMGTDLSPSPCSLVTQDLHSWGKSKASKYPALEPATGRWVPRLTRSYLSPR